MTIKTVLESGKCYGCGVCMYKCKQNAIDMVVNEFGCIAPRIDDQKCIVCDACLNVCELRFDYAKPIEEKEAFVAFNKENKIREASASGGIFSACAKYVIEQGGVVWGAVMNLEDREPVQHSCCNILSQLKEMQGSKYVQSSIYTSFPKIKSLLNENKLILFSGTSCQVDALYRFLGTSNQPNLITIDLIDHGVPGGAFFKSYVVFLEKKYGGKINEFRFRRKKDERIYYEEVIKIQKSESLEELEVIIPVRKSAYYYSFLFGESYRESCYSCKFSSINKPGDITIGDYFELAKDYPEYANASGEKYIGARDVSCAIANSEKGGRLLQICSEMIEMRNVNVEKVINSHQQLREPMQFSSFRRKIIKAYKTRGYEGVDKEFKKMRIVSVPKRLVQKIIPKSN